MAAAAPRRIEIVGWGWPKSNVGGVSRFQSSSYFSGGIGCTTTGALNDEMVWEVLLDAGTWALDVLWVSGNNRGVGTYYLDATSLGTQDQYTSGTSTYATTFTGITVASVGTYPLKAKAESKNASSSAYFLCHNLLVLRRTGA